jgi:hypothetical protein
MKEQLEATDHSNAINDSLIDDSHVEIKIEKKKHEKLGSNNKWIIVIVLLGFCLMTAGVIYI